MPRDAAAAGLGVMGTMELSGGESTWNQQLSLVRGRVNPAQTSLLL